MDVIVIGAGIVGLATAYQLLRIHPSWNLTVLEKEEGPALHQTGRNSGVVHTGIYYKPGSLKAKNCIQGRKELLEYCGQHGIGYRKIHKVIVATGPQEFARLDAIYERGQANGVPGLKIIGKEELQEIEPHVSALKALYVPECHIIEYKTVAHSLVDSIRKLGGNIVFHQKIEDIHREGNRIRAIGAKTFEGDLLINCGGLHCDRLARACLGPKKIDQSILPFRGEYYDLSPSKTHLVKGLIYPVPNPKFPFLGVHLTHMMNGKVEAGPNAVLAWAREGYGKLDFQARDMKEVLAYSGFWMMALRYWQAGCYELIRSMSKKLFLRDLRRLVPEIEEKDLTPGGRGIRAQVVTKKGKLLDDFSLYQDQNSLHVLNAPSPAATASFSIGRMLAEMATHSGAA